MTTLIAKRLASVKACLGDNSEFETIAQMCSLQPGSSWEEWHDSEGNILRIGENQTINVSRTKNQIYLTKDIFRKAKPELIQKHSYWFVGFFSSEKSIVTFLGNDGLIRVSFFESSWLYNICPLLLGYPVLKLIASSYLDSEPKKLSLTKTSFTQSFVFNDVWCGGLPIEDENLKRKLQQCLQTK